jgi:hypothetical protein
MNVNLPVSRLARPWNCESLRKRQVGDRSTGATQATRSSIEKWRLALDLRRFTQPHHRRTNRPSHPASMDRACEPCASGSGTVLRNPTQQAPLHHPSSQGALWLLTQKGTNGADGGIQNAAEIQNGHCTTPRQVSASIGADLVPTGVFVARAPCFLGQLCPCRVQHTRCCFYF